MEFSIERNELLAGLYLMQGIAERRTTVPILSNVLIESTGSDSISVAATDQEIAVRRRCVATVRKKGSLTTSARKLFEMVRELGEGEIRIRSQDNNWIEISAGRSRFRLVGLDPREFPAIPESPAGTQGQVVTVPGEVLATMIERTIFAISGDETRVNLNGLYVEGAEDGRLRIVATDGHRLAMITRPVDSGKLEKGVIIPRKAVVELRKVLESGEEAIELSVVSGMAHARRGAVQMSMRLVEGEFPDYRQVVPGRSERVATVDSGELVSALRRVSIVSSERTRGVKMQIDGQKLELSSINPDVGEAAEEIAIDYDGQPVAIGFNAKYLLEALAAQPSDGRVEIGLNDEVSPGVVRYVGDPDYCYIVMPMRL